MAANINTLAASYVSGNTALATRIDNLGVFSNTNNQTMAANINTLAASYVSGNTALATRIDNLGAYSNANARSLAANVSTLTAAYTTSNSALASSITTLTTRVGNVRNYVARSLGLNAWTSRGYPVNGKGGLYIDGSSTPVAPGAATSVQTSYNLYVINRANGNVVFSNYYDLFSAASTYGPLLASKLNSLDSNNVIVLTTFDEPSYYHLTYGVANAVYRCGGSRSTFAGTYFPPAAWGDTTWLLANLSDTRVQQWKFRSAYVLVGIPGLGEGTGLERYVGPADSSNESIAEVSFSIRDGYVTGLPGSGSTGEASISQVFSTANGLSAQWAVQASVGGTSGGLVFTGLQKADGSGEVYTLDINSNVNIYGNLVVAGTIDNAQLADFAASHSAMTSGTKNSGIASVDIRANSRVGIFASYSGSNDLNLSGGKLTVYADGYKALITPLQTSGALTTPVTTMTVFSGVYPTGKIALAGSVDQSNYYSYYYEQTNWEYVCAYGCAWLPVTRGYTTNYVGAWAFDGSVTSTWIANWSNTAKAWIQYQFTTQQQVSNVTLMAYSSAAGGTAARAPKSLTIEGSNNRTSWVVLNTINNLINWGDQEIRYLPTATSNSYNNWRVNVTSVVSGAETYLNMAEIGFMIYTPVLTFPRQVQFYADVEGAASTPTGSTTVYIVELSK
jgi:hypothetical protein